MDKFMNISKMSSYNFGDKKINNSEINELCNKIACELTEILIDKIKHLEPNSMFNTAINTSIYLLTTIFTNILCQAIGKKDQQKFKESIIDQVSNNLTHAIYGYGNVKHE